MAELGRRGFLGSLLGLAGAAALNPSSILGLEGAYARTYVATPAVTWSQSARMLAEVYSAEDYFRPYLEATCPLLEGLEGSTELFWG